MPFNIIYTSDKICLKLPCKLEFYTICFFSKMHFSLSDLYLDVTITVQVEIEMQHMLEVK